MLGFFGISFWVLTHEIPDKNHDAVVYLLGVLNGAMLAVIGYFYGSSVGSAGKQTITSQHPESATPAPASQPEAAH